MAAEKFDIIVFGASGFTGKHCVKDLAEIWDENPGLKWAVAGRNIAKLEAVVEWASEKSGRDLSKVGFICADVSNEASLNSMCQQGKLILNLVGPYTLYGQPVVEACVKNNCHHVDLCGETKFLEETRLDYHERAKAAGVYILGQCGFGSIPTDLGVLFVKREFPGILNSVESYMTIKPGTSGLTIHFGTLHSELQNLADLSKISAIREKLNPAPLPECKPKLDFRQRPFFSEFSEGWNAPMSGPAIDTTEHSQRFLYRSEKERPVQFAAYMCQSSLWKLISALLIIMTLVIVGFFKCGRRLIEKYPEYFTFGIFSHQGPTETQLAETSFTIKSRGRGFSTEAAANAGREDMEIITQVNGPEPAYIATSSLMVQAGLTILQETEKLPEKGGVYTPGAAFYKTTLIDRCNKHGVKFSVIKEGYKV